MASTLPGHGEDNHSQWSSSQTSNTKLGDLQNLPIKCQRTQKPEIVPNPINLISEWKQTSYSRTNWQKLRMVVLATVISKLWVNYFVSSFFLLIYNHILKKQKTDLFTSWLIIVRDSLTMVNLKMCYCPTGYNQNNSHWRRVTGK